jgi:hypothetical protein
MVVSPCCFFPGGKVEILSLGLLSICKSTVQGGFRYQVCAFLTHDEIVS